LLLQSYKTLEQLTEDSESLLLVLQDFRFQAHLLP